MLVVCIGEKSEILCSIIEILLCEHSIVYENLQVIPLLFKLFAVVLEYGLQTIGHFLRNICRNFLHVRVTLQIRTVYIQRNIRRIKYAMQQCQKVRNNTLYRICYIYLIAIKLDFILVQLYITFHLREVQDTSEMERIIYVQMYPEQRLIGHRIKVAIELLIILVFQFTGFQCPQRIGVINDIIFGRFNLLAVFPLFFLTECNRNRKEAAIFLQKRREACLFKEFLAIIVYIKNDIRTAFCLVRIFNCKFRATVASPFYGFSTILIGFSDDFNLLGNHES